MLKNYLTKRTAPALLNFTKVGPHEYVFFANFGLSMEDIPQWAYDLLTAHAVPRIFLCSKSNIPRGYLGVKIGQIDV